jgi:outer membrane protein insertion porin family
MGKSIPQPLPRISVLLAGLLAGAVLFVTVPTWGAEAPTGQSAGVPSVKAVLIEGNQRVAESTILFHISTREGDPFSVYSIREDLKKIYGLGYFEDVSVDVAEFEGGLKIIFHVVEKPTLRAISFSGNDKIDGEEFRTNMPLREGAILNRSLVQEGVTVIQFLYHQKGYLFVKVEPTYHSSADNQVDLEFKIYEGKKAFVQTISFTGNKTFSEKELAKHIDTSTWGVFSFLTLDGTYVRDVVKNDRVKLVQFYHNNGFIDVTVGEPAVEIDDKSGRIYITFSIIEGPQYRVASINVQGDEDNTEEQLKNFMMLKDGEVFKKDRLRRDILTLTNFYSTQGYAFADVSPLTRRNTDDNTVDLFLEVDKGQKVFVEKVNIKGNFRTRDRVIRREFRLSEGEAYDSSKLALTRRNLQYTGFFEEVTIDTNRGSEDDTVVIDTEVRERPTGVFGIGAGYSSVESFLVGFRIQQDNWGGRGQKLSFKGNFSGIRRRFRLNFWEPSVADSTIGFGLGLTNILETFPLYDQDTRGFDATLAKDFRDIWQGSLTYRLEEVELMNINSGAIGLIEEGTIAVGSLTPSVGYNSTDSRWFPHRGIRQFYALEISAEPLGSDVEYWKMNADWRRYFEVREDIVYSPRVRVGVGRSLDDEPLPAFERYFAGGTTTVRGFKLRDIGPSIGEGVFRRSLGGDARFILNNEVRFPLVQQLNLSGVTFIDAGNVYEEIEDIDPTDLRYGTGAGLRLLSPVGPIGLDYGIKIDRQPGEELGEFHLSLGSQF